MLIYVDEKNKCHVKNDGTMTAVEDSFFDGRCEAFIEGYKLEEAGGLRHIYPFESSRVLEAYQKQYEAMLAEMSTAYQEGVNSI